MVRAAYSANCPRETMSFNHRKLTIMRVMFNPFRILGKSDEKRVLAANFDISRPSFRVPRRQIRQTRVVKAVEDKYAA